MFKAFAGSFKYLISLINVQRLGIISSVVSSSLVISDLLSESVTPGKKSPEREYSWMNLKSELERAGALDWMDSMLEESVAIIVTISEPKIRVRIALMRATARTISCDMLDSIPAVFFMLTSSHPRLIK